MTSLMNSASLRPTLNRIEIIDALRGFALAGIVLVHMVEQYLAAPAPDGRMDALVQGPADQAVDAFIFLFLRGKFFALFSLLFGLSFFIQMDRAAQKGSNFRLRFIWRLLILLAIGYLHHLFYRGDILTIYAILGLFLVPFHRLGTGWILAVTVMIFAGIPRYLIYGIYGAGNLLSSLEFSPDSPELLTYFLTLKEGSILQVFASNATEGHLMKADFQIGVFSRAYLTFGFFLVGLLLGRMRFFENFEPYIKQLKRILIWGFLALVALIGFTILIFSGQEESGNQGFDSWLAMLGFTLFDLFNLVTTAMIVAGFTLLYRRMRFEQWFNTLSPYGRTALTNYVLQSVIGTAIFYGWGLGLLGDIRNIYAFILGLAIILFQVWTSKWWLNRFRYGPLEWIWRVLTYGRFFPLLQEKEQAKQIA